MIIKTYGMGTSKYVIPSWNILPSHPVLHLDKSYSSSKCWHKQYTSEKSFQPTCFRLHLSGPCWFPLLFLPFIAITMYCNCQFYVSFTTKLKFLKGRTVSVLFIVDFSELA